MAPWSFKLVTLLTLCATSLAQLASDEADLGYVTYKGATTYGDVITYHGVPYAEPPLGARRFRKPTPLDTTRITTEANGETVDLTQPAAFCIQGGSGTFDPLQVRRALH